MKLTKNFLTLLTVFTFVLCASAAGSYAATIYVTNYGDGKASLANAKSAYNAASAGDTIVFPASGSATWSSALTVGKAVTIDGAGTTLMGNGSLGSGGFFTITGITSSETIRITGFVFTMNTTSESGIRVVSNTADNIRIDHNTFNYGVNVIVLYNPKGLIDNNYFYNSLKSIDYSAGSIANAHASWASMAAGTANATFIEDNHFIFNSNYSKTAFQECIGTENGGKLVCRYNTFDSTACPLNSNETIYTLQTHGNALGGSHNNDPNYGYWQRDTTATGAKRGQSVVEAYNNTIKARRVHFMFSFRGSANIVYNNTVVRTEATPMTRIEMYEEEQYETSNWTPSRTAWPAEDQVHNTFFWNNTVDGTQINTSYSTYFAVHDGSSTYIQKDRDFFLHAPCGASDTIDAYNNTCTHGKETFTGLNGGSASYPTNGSTYTTLGNMSFTATGDNAYYGYTPYTYPHPFRVPGSPPKAPNLFVVPTTTTVP